MRLKRTYVALSAFITLVFLVLGATLFYKSYARLIETLGDFWDSIVYYFREIFGAGHSTDTLVGITQGSGVLEGEHITLPETPQGFWTNAGLYFKLLFDKANFQAWLQAVADVLMVVMRLSVLALPLIVLLVYGVKSMYAKPNANYNRDTIPLRIFKAVSAVTYQPVKRFILGYKEYLDEHEGWKTAWLWIWLANINAVSIMVAFFAYYFYFVASFDFSSVDPQMLNLIKDIGLVLRHFPWFITGAIAWILFSRFREGLAKNTLQYHEARNCGFIKELPIVTMTCGSMGKKKTTMTTDMALSQTVMFRQEAFKRLQKQDMKFPFFPWICFERELRKKMAENKVNNLASIRTWVQDLRRRYEKESKKPFDLYGYDVVRYGLYYDSGLKKEYLFDVLETYAKLYFIYVIESSLLVSNYSIREEDGLYKSPNFPMRGYDFFKMPADVEKTRFAKILDFDVLRLGKKVIERNRFAGSFEFGVVVITEVGKERANNLELRELKKSADETNQKNDLFNAWLKMCRHSATVDNFPFIKVFTDEQRPESWGADARDLADIIAVRKDGGQKLALPFFTLEEWLYEKTFEWFLGLYYDFRFRRGDNTLLVHVCKSVVCKIWAHYERMYNRFGYTTLNLDKERGTREDRPERKKYFLANYKIYRDRFSTDCFSDYFNELAEKSGVGLRDYYEYATAKASVEELKKQNSYFIRMLYGE